MPSRLTSRRIPHAALICALALSSALVAQTLDPARQSRLDQAARLTASGQYREALAIYRELFGSNPPRDWALSYYETEAATETGRPHAIAGLRALASEDPANVRLQIALGKVLTYDPRTRDEGQRYLAAFPRDSAAVQALGQSLLWDSSNPAAAPATPAKIRSFLALHPDVPLAPMLAHALARLTPPDTGPLPAVSHGASPRRQPTRRALAPARSPSPEPVRRTREISSSPPVPTQAPSALDAWRSLLIAQQQAGDSAAALSTDSRVPPELRSELLHDPAYLLALAAAFAESNRTEDFRTTLELALDLQLPTSVATLSPELATDGAGILLLSGRPAAAAALYRQALLREPTLLPAQQGLAEALVAENRPADALAVLAALTPVKQAAALQDPTFVIAIASAQAQQGDLSQARSLLEATLASRAHAGRAIPPSLAPKLADIELAANAPADALPIYRQILARQPDRADALTGLLAALHAAHQDTYALAELDRMAPSTRAKLHRDPDFLEIAAAIYASLDRPRLAAEELALAESLYNSAGSSIPPAVTLERATLILRLPPDEANDAALYRALTTLTADPNLTELQRQSADTLWAALAVRRAENLLAQQNTPHALAVLTAAVGAFPLDPVALRGIAGALVAADRPAGALAIFQSPRSPPVTAADYAVAIRAAQLQSDGADSDRWLSAGRRIYPNDPTLLLLAAESEHSHGHSRRAIMLYRASLKSLAPPPASANSQLTKLLAPDVPSRSAQDWRDELRILLSPQTAPASESAPPTPQPSTHQPRSNTLRDYTPPPDPGGSSFGPYVPYRPASAAARSAPVRRFQTISFDPQDAHTQVPQPAQPRVGQMGGPPGGVPDTGQQQYPQPSTPPRPPLPRRSAPVPLPPSTNSTQTPTPTAPEPVPAIAPPYLLPLPTTPNPAGAAAFATIPQPAIEPIVNSNAIRRQAETGLASLEGSYTGWFSSVPTGRLRSGAAGLDRLVDLEAPTELSIDIAQSARLTAVAQPVSLTSGTPDPGAYTVANTPYLGTQPAVTLNSGSSSASGLTQQYTTGLGGELQLSTAHLALAAGYTPYQFPTRTITGRFALTAPHITLFAARQPVRDTLLSYAGLYDPGQPAHPLWGGIVANTAGFRLAAEAPSTHFFLSAETGFTHGTHVHANTVLRGQTGAEFRLARWRSVGDLTAGASVTGMHFQRNQSGLTYGQAGLFSPQQYLNASAPIRFAGSHRGLHYDLEAAPVFVTYQLATAPFFPLDPALQAAFVPATGIPCTSAQLAANTCGRYPAETTHTVAYDVNGRLSYLAGTHFYVGAFISATDQRGFEDVSSGLSFRYTFLPQRQLEGYPIGDLPADSLHPLQLP